MADPPPRPDPHRADVHRLLDRYWLTNVRIMMGLLVAWALVSLVGGVLIADRLNAFTIPGTGFPLGFWLAHQGSIVVFVLLILVYCLMMNRLDRQHHADLERLRREQA